MKFSHYLKIWPYPEKPGLNLLYSTKKSALALVPDEACQALAQGKEVPDQIVAQLRELGMLVPDLDTERREVFAMHEELNRLNTGVTGAIILNLDCNFACRYCYEGTMKGKHYMSDTVADQVISFLQDRLHARKRKLKLDYYGGEPLLSVNRIKYLSEALKPYVEESGSRYTFNLVTNGSLLTPRVVKELKPFGLESAKVTIDGLAANHNFYRPFKSGKESFPIILANIKECCDLIDINLGGNFTAVNYQEFPRLLDLLMEHGLTPEKIPHIRFHPVMQTTDQYSVLERNSGCSSINAPWVIEASLFLRQEILRRGYHTAKITPEICMVEVEDSFTVNYNGEICKCPAMIGHNTFIAGDVVSGLQDYRDTYQLHNWRQKEECLICEYLPMCFGGCRYVQYQRDGVINGVDCQKAFFDATLETMLRQDIQYRYDKHSCHETCHKNH